MDRALWQRLEWIFAAALEHSPEGRGALLDRICAGNRWLRAEVEAMLSAHESQGELHIERGVLSDTGRLSFEPSSLAPGTRIGSYSIEERIGVGGMGEVYRAQRVDGAYTQTVAIKVLRPGYNAADMVRLFQAERQILARLEHPGIATILDGGATSDGRPYLVLQYVDGVPITEYCRSNLLDTAARLRLFLRVCEAVQFAHGRLVVHRDIKPSNILVTRQGEPRLLDFGIARLLTPVSDDAPHTRTGFRLLTPEHAAPEQLSGETVGTAADVYALGVLLFELLTGKRPFRAGNPLELQQAILDGISPAPSTVCDNKQTARRLRGDLDRIVLMALRKEPERRYASAGQFAEDVERHLAGLPVRAQRDTLRYRAGKFVRRNRALVTGAAAFLLLLTSFAANQAVQSRRLARERDRAEQQRASAEAVAGMLTRLFESSNPYVSPGGDTLRVSTFLEQGEREIDQLNDQPELQARMWRVLGAMHAARGRYERAQALLERSWQRRVQLNGPNDTVTLSTYHELAQVINSWQGPNAARPMLQHSVTQFERTLGAKHPDVSKALQDLAGVTNNVRERAALIKRADAALDTVSNPVTRAAALNNSATDNWNRGRVAEAAALFRASLDLLEPALPPDHPNRLLVTGNLASALSALGDFERGETLQRSVYEARRRVLGEQHATTALAQEGLALMMAEQGKLERAEEMLNAVLATERALLAPGHWRIANTMRNLALVRAARGQVAEGLALLDSAIAQHQERGQGHDYMMGQRTTLLLSLGRTEEAAQAAFAADSALRGSVESARHSYLGDASMWLGTVALVQGDAAQAASRFSSALERMRTNSAATHPRRAGAECALGIALAEQQKTAESASALRACPAYVNYALANPIIAARARQLLAR